MPCARFLAVGGDIHVPHLSDMEVAHLLRRFCRQKVLSPARAELLVEHYVSRDLERHAHLPFLARVWQLRHNFSAYDALYVALAEALECPLLTADRWLGAAALEFVTIELV